MKNIREYLAEYFDDITVLRPDVVEMMLDSQNYPFTKFGKVITPSETQYINWVVENFYNDVVLVNRKLYYSSCDILVLIKLSIP